ncbi:MAG TPA: universal stress protein [Solirubrobacteraceae bacterium]|nr:universal stress protein [Solirubrobacteraceae bacterium]
MSILICYDDSQSARRALAVAQRTLAHHPATLLHVYGAPEAVLADAFSTRGSDPSSGATSQDRLETMASRRAHAIIDNGRALAAEHDLPVDAEVREAHGDDKVWQTILAVADELDAELIVAGTRGCTAVQDRSLGSVSEALIRHSQRPVLIVPAGG